MELIYSPGAIQALAIHYHDDHEDILAVDAYADFDAALDWLQCAAPELFELLTLWMLGHMEVDLAIRYRFKPRTLARLLDQTFTILAQYLNDERPIVLPNLDALRDAEAADVLSDFVLALVSLSMSFSFYS